jgi:hypothetical protein
MKHDLETRPRCRAHSLPSSRWSSSCAAFMILTVVSMTGCGSVGKSIGIGLLATGGIATATTGILAFGCTTPNLNNPQIQERGPCLPPQTYEETKPVLWTTFVLGIIMAAAGVAVIATIDEKPRQPDPPRRPSREPVEEESCKESKYCY